MRFFAFGQNDRSKIFDLKIGVLAIQGNFAAHAAALQAVGAEAVEVRKPEELAGLDGLIIPGGESTTILKFLEHGDFFAQLKSFVQKSPPSAPARAAFCWRSMCRSQRSGRWTHWTSSSSAMHMAGRTIP